MESVHKIVDSTKDLLTSLTSESNASAPSTTNNQSSTTTSSSSPSDDLLGVTSGQTLLATDRGDAPLSGDIERQSGTNDDTTGGYLPYSATGRDSTGTFSGGANEDILNLGAGELPGKQ
ncbi:uncharacterized protein JCM6883_001201 [Sporobolomyces salmoneus]|uniref:uncharacterized protein n=1 Tax=Sporobolomyces salmoneus TaxID=183962 RepID=UPI0031770D10